MASSEPRDKTFLDEPEAYPEYALIVNRESLHHALRLAFHRHRTAALLLIVAISVACSGAKMPTLWNSTAKEWLAYFGKGLSVDLLVRHFEGVGSAMLCVSAVTVASLLAYPLHVWASPREKKDNMGVAPSPSASSRNARATIASGAVTATIVWVIAVWAAGRLSWGVASGLIVALQSTGLTVKLVSFVQACGSGFTADDGPRNGGGVDGCDGSVAPNLGKGGEVGEGLGNDARALTFGEFVYFLLLAPSLVCHPSQLRECARRPRNVTRAASEFLHSALAFLAVHTTCSTFYAPANRVLAVAVHSRWSDADSWIDTSAWETLRMEGSGDWLHNLALTAGGTWLGEETSDSVAYGRVIFFAAAVAAAWFGMFVFSPMQHFLMFYGFWHCICLGSAELWGYPDRNIYGPWWLVMDDLRDYFRMWSAPVYRWLAASVQRPMLEAGRRAARRRASVASGKKVHGSGGSCDRGGTIFWRWWFASVVCSFLVSGLLHEAVGFIALRRTVWPFNTLFLAMSATMTPWWDVLFPAVCAQSVAGSESTAGLSRKTLAQKPPAETGKGGARSTAQYSDIVASNGEPNINPSSAARKDPSNTSCSLSRTSCAAGGSELASKGSPEKRAVMPRPAIGSYRGWFAVVFYFAASVPMTLLVDYLLWQWWRQTVGVR